VDQLIRVLVRLVLLVHAVLKVQWGLEVYPDAQVHVDQQDQQVHVGERERMDVKDQKVQWDHKG
jgi:hypothetical protein